MAESRSIALTDQLLEDTYRRLANRLAWPDFETCMADPVRGRLIRLSAIRRAIARQQIDNQPAKKHLQARPANAPAFRTLPAGYIDIKRRAAGDVD